jgi:hypothetical protein
MIDHITPPARLQQQQQQQQQEEEEEEEEEEGAKRNARLPRPTPRRGIQDYPP